MVEKNDSSDLERHRLLGAELNGLVWELLDKSDRLPADDERMLHAAHASCYHWLEAGTPANHARGEWLISRVYAVLDKPEPALHFARRCLEICEKHGIGDFDIAYAYEAMARAYSLVDDQAQFDRFLGLAREAGDAIAGDEDKKLFLSDLSSLTG
jgi:hypothetical protein